MKTEGFKITYVEKDSLGLTIQKEFTFTEASILHAYRSRRAIYDAVHEILDEVLEGYFPNEENVNTAPVEIEFAREFNEYNSIKPGVKP